jgi:hypothetical protein
MAFTIEPAFWADIVVQFLAVLITLPVVVIFYRARTMTMANQLNTWLSERLANGPASHELHNILLQGLSSTSMPLHMTAEEVPDDSIAKPQLNHILELMERVGKEGRGAPGGL